MAENETVALMRLVADVDDAAAMAVYVSSIFYLLFGVILGVLWYYIPKIPTPDRQVVHRKGDVVRTSTGEIVYRYRKGDVMLFDHGIPHRIDPNDPESDWERWQENLPATYEQDVYASDTVVTNVPGVVLVLATIIWVVILVAIMGPIFYHTYTRPPIL